MAGEEDPNKLSPYRITKKERASEGNLKIAQGQLKTLGVNRHSPKSSVKSSRCFQLHKKYVRFGPNT